MQFEEYALKLNAGDLASRSKAKAKPQKTRSTRTIPIGENLDWCWTRKTFALRHIHCRRNWSISFVMEALPRDNDGSDWILENKRLSSETFLGIVIIGLTKTGRAAWQEEEDKRKDFSIVLIHQGTSLYLRALQVHSWCNLIGPSLQGQCINSGRFLQVHLSHRMCNQFYTPSWIQDWYQEDKNWAIDRRYSFTSVEPMNKEHRNPNKIDLEAPRLAWYHQKMWKKHQNTLYWVDINLASEERIQVLSDTIERHQLIASRQLFGWKLEKSYTRKFLRHLGLLQRSSFKDKWMKE